jgi:hypothetical protein
MTFDHSIRVNSSGADERPASSNRKSSNLKAAFNVRGLFLRVIFDCRRSHLLAHKRHFVGVHRMKPRDSGRGPAIGTSKKRAGCGCRVSAPSVIRKTAICSCTARAIDLNAAMSVLTMKG